MVKILVIKNNIIIEFIIDNNKAINGLYLDDRETIVNDKPKKGKENEIIS